MERRVVLLKAAKDIVVVIQIHLFTLLFLLREHGGFLLEPLL